MNAGAYKQTFVSRVRLRAVNARVFACLLRPGLNKSALSVVSVRRTDIVLLIHVILGALPFQLVLHEQNTAGQGLSIVPNFCTEKLLVRASIRSRQILSSQRAYAHISRSLTHRAQPKMLSELFQLSIQISFCHTRYSGNRSSLMEREPILC